MLTNSKRVSESNLIKELNRSLIGILYRQSGYKNDHKRGRNLYILFLYLCIYLIPNILTFTVKSKSTF